MHVHIRTSNPVCALFVSFYYEHKLTPTVNLAVFLCVPCVLWLFILFSFTGRKKTWEFVKANIGELKRRLGGAFLLPRVLEMTTNSFASEDVAKEIEVCWVGLVCVATCRHTARKKYEPPSSFC